MINSNTNREQIDWYDYFLEILHKKYPKKAQLTQSLMDLLLLERESTYRRLRREVVFSAHEIMTIASAWGISLDELANVDLDVIPFHLRPINYLNPSKKESDFLREVIEAINYLKVFPNTEFLDVCNKLPRQLLAGYNYLNQLSLFKWRYQYGDENAVIPFSEVIVSDDQKMMNAEYYHAIKNVPNSSFIWDSRIFEYLINDVLYFCSIYLITEEDKQLIKNDLKNLLNYLFEVASMGCYPETKNKVNLYISHLNINANYSYTFSPKAHVCFVHVFEKYEIFSFHADMLANFKRWMQSKKRTSIQISEVDEKNRIEFFSKQRQLLELL